MAVAWHARRRPSTNDSKLSESSTEQEEIKARKQEVENVLWKYRQATFNFEEFVDSLSGDPGFVTLVSEFSGVEEKLLKNLTEPELRKWFEQIDTDRSGAVNFTEITASLMKMQRQVKFRKWLSERAASRVMKKPHCCIRMLKSKLFWISILALVLFLFGVYMCTYDGTMDTLTGFYVMMQVVTTVGYGDVTPQSDLAKLSVSFYVLVCLVIIAYAVNEVVMTVLSTHEQSAVLASAGACMGSVKMEVFRNTLALVAFLMFGTFYYSIQESCTCGYGSSHGLVDGCDDGGDDFDYERCVATGGLTKTRIDCFYMSVITLTSVGFGDYSPASYRGRSIGVVWVVAGVAVAGAWVNSVSSLLFDHHVGKKREGIVKEELLAQVDWDMDDKLSRAEHHLYWLATRSVVSLETLDELDTAFNALADKEDKVLVSHFLKGSGDTAASNPEDRMMQRAVARATVRNGDAGLQQRSNIQNGALEQEGTRRGSVMQQGKLERPAQRASTMPEMQAASTVNPGAVTNSGTRRSSTAQMREPDQRVTFLQ